MSRSDRRPKAAEEARSGVTRRRGEPKVMTTLRLRRCPGIYFADEPSGRTAKVGGTGLGVWEVLRDFCQGDDLEALRQTFPDLSQAQLTARQAVSRRASGFGGVPSPRA